MELRSCHEPNVSNLSGMAASLADIKRNVASHRAKEEESERECE